MLHFVFHGQKIVLVTEHKCSSLHWNQWTAVCCHQTPSSLHGLVECAVSQAVNFQHCRPGCSAAETVGTNFPSWSFVVAGNNYGCLYLYVRLNIFIWNNIERLRGFTECVRVVYVMWALQWFAGLDLLCLRVCVCMCICVFASVCVCEFLKAKSWHFAQHVGWGKNTTRIYSSLLSCHRQVASVLELYRTCMLSVCVTVKVSALQGLCV